MQSVPQLHQRRFAGVVLSEGFSVKCGIVKANTVVSRKPDMWNRSNNQNSTELLEVTVPLA